MMISKHALEFSILRLLKSGDGNAYLWTFTLRNCIDVSEARKEWNKALIYIRRTLPDYHGVRVFELHPGGHGLHVHVITNNFFGVTYIRDQALKNTPWGRVNVKRWKKNTGDPGAYLAKYVSKARRPDCLKGWRLWAPFGGWDHCRCKDVWYDSSSKRVFNWLMENYLGWDSLNWYQKCQVHQTTLTNYYMQENVEFIRDKESGVVKLIRPSPSPSL